MPRIIVALLALALGACAKEPAVVAVAIPNLPKVDPALLAKLPPPGCVTDRSPAISVRTLASERDCFRNRALAVEDRLTALQASVVDVEATVEQMRADAAKATPK